MVNDNLILLNDIVLLKYEAGGRFTFDVHGPSGALKSPINLPWYDEVVEMEDEMRSNAVDNKFNSVQVARMEQAKEWIENEADDENDCFYTTVPPAVAKLVNL